MVVAALILVLGAGTAVAQGNRVVLTFADGGKVVHVLTGEIVHVQLTGDAPAGPCARAWGPISSSDHRVLVPAGSTTSGGDATADFRADAVGSAHIGAHQRYLLSPTSPTGTPVACPAISIAWLGVTVVVDPSAGSGRAMTGLEVAVMLAAAGFALALGVAVTRLARRPARPA